MDRESDAGGTRGGANDSVVNVDEATSASIALMARRDGTMMIGAA